MSGRGNRVPGVHPYLPGGTACAGGCLGSIFVGAEGLTVAVQNDFRLGVDRLWCFRTREVMLFSFY